VASVLALVGLSLGLVACGTPDPAGGDGGRDRTPRAPSGPADDGSPLTALPPCGPPPAATASVTDVPGLVLPPAVIITATGPLTAELTEARGYIAATPVEVRQFYEREPDLTIFELEDEIFESEVLVERGAFRTYMKANAACSDGSTIYAVVGPAGTGSVPSPTGR